MNMDPGFIPVGVTMLIFYLRLAQLRGRHRKQARQDALARLQAPKRMKAADLPPIPDKNQPSYQVVSWWLVVFGSLLMLVGLAIRTSNWFPPEFLQYWWAVVSAGVLVFVFCFK